MPDVSNPPPLTESGDVDHDQTSNRTHGGDDLTPNSVLTGALEATGEISVPELTSDPSQGNIWIRSDL